MGQVGEKMRVLLFGSQLECDDIIAKFCELDSLKYGSFVHTDDTDKFLELLVSASPNLIVVLCNGASGMERVITARNICADTPLFWISDDKDFGAQSYRLHCSYFMVKPVTVEKLKKATGTL